MAVAEAEEDAGGAELLGSVEEEEGGGLDEEEDEDGGCVDDEGVAEELGSAVDDGVGVAEPAGILKVDVHACPNEMVPPQTPGYSAVHVALSAAVHELRGV